MGCGASTASPPKNNIDVVEAKPPFTPNYPTTAAAEQVNAAKLKPIAKPEAAKAVPEVPVAATSGKSLAALPKAHLHLHFRQSGRQSRIKEFMSEFNDFVKEKTAKYDLKAQEVLDAPEKLDALKDQGLEEPELEWIAAIEDAKKDYDKAVNSVEAAKGDDKKSKAERKVKKTKQKYDALFEGLKWPSVAEIEDPLKIEEAPMTFAGFTEITVMQQSIIGCHPLTSCFLLLASYFYTYYRRCSSRSSAATRGARRLPSASCCGTCVSMQLTRASDGLRSYSLLLTSSFSLLTSYR